MQNSSWIGSSVRRKEDLRLVTGKGSFIDDISLPGMLHAYILRSPYAHAKISNIDARKAETSSGVSCVLTGNEVRSLQKPLFNLVGANISDYCMAVDKVRFAGEPVVAIAATSKSLAKDASDLIEVNYEPLPPVLDPKVALRSNDALVHENLGHNVAWHDTFTYGDVGGAFRKAALIVEEDFKFHRYSASPIETLGCIADYSPGDGSLTVYDNQQASWGHFIISESLGIPKEKFRLIQHDIGGAFGVKAFGYVNSALTALLSKKCRKPVKWIEERTEHYIATPQSGERYYHVSAAVERNGRILGLKTEIIDDEGAYVRPPEPSSMMVPMRSFVGCYRIESLYIDAYSIFTNKVPTGASRGYGSQHHYFMLERLTDIIAKRLGIDVAEMRFRNLIQPDQFPYLTPTGSLYDSGNYPLLLKRALELVDYQGIRNSQVDSWKQGRYVGVGVAVSVSPAVSNLSRNRLFNPKLEEKGAPEIAKLTMESDGKVSVAMGSIPQGQGHETVAAQIVADKLSTSYDDVNVLTGFDTLTHPFTFASGTWASRFSTVQVGALVMAADKLRQRMCRVAANALGCAPSEVRLAKGAALNRIRNKSVTYAELYRQAEERGVSLSVTSTFDVPTFDVPNDKRMMNFGGTYASQATAAVVEIDPETGQVKILKYVIVHDCGTVLNPAIVDGQIVGGVIQGIGGAMYECHVYSEDGNLLTTTLMDYLLPTAEGAITPVVEHHVTTSPFSPLGSKGVGESGAEPANATLANAVEDALTPLNAKITDSYLSPERIWNWFRNRTA